MSARPVSTAAEDRATVYSMASMLKASLPAGHPGHAKLDELLQRHAPLVIATPAEAKAIADSDSLALIMAAASAILYTAAGYVAHWSISGAITAALLGALALNIAFDRSDAA